MKKTPKTYSNEELSRLSGKIKESEYSRDVQAVLKEWGTERDLGYIVQVVNQTFYNEEVWNAVIEVIDKRKKARKSRKEFLELLLQD